MTYHIVCDSCEYENVEESELITRFATMIHQVLYSHDVEYMEVNND